MISDVVKSVKPALVASLTTGGGIIAQSCVLPYTLAEMYLDLSKTLLAITTGKFISLEYSLLHSGVSANLAISADLKGKVVPNVKTKNQ